MMIKIPAACFQFCALAMLSLSAMPAHADGETIGNLFSSPRERAALDQARQASSKNTLVAKQVSDQITLDGFVRKQNGKATVWINQVPQHEQENPQGITILKSERSPRTVSMRLPSGKSVNLKAGQSFDATNGQVTEVYDDTTAIRSKDSAK